MKSRLPYVLAVVIVAAASALQWLAWPFIQPSPFLLLSLAILLAARDERWGPGLLATLVAAFAVNVLFLAPYASMSLGWRALVTTGLFALVGIFITGLTVSRRRTMKVAAERARWFATTLHSIGDAVIATGPDGRVEVLNSVAEQLTGWDSAAARGQPLDAVFRIINENTRARIENPVDRVVHEGTVVGLSNHTILVSRSGDEFIVEDSAAPIRDGDGKLVGVVLVFRDSTRKSREQQRKEVLADVGAALGSSLDYEQTLQRVAEVAVPRFADWCAVHLVEPTGEIRQVAVHHVDATKVELARRVGRDYPQDPSWHVGIPHVIRTGEPQWMPEISDDTLVNTAVDEQHLALLRGLGLRSYVMAPLRARGHTLGVVTFVMAESGRTYRQSDVAFARDLAERAAMAVDNASLYTRSLDAIRARDEFLSIASHELKTPLATLQLQLDVLQDSMSAVLENNARLTAQLATAHRQALRLANLVEELLDVSRITTGRLPLDTDDMDLVQLAGEVVDRFQRDAHRHGCDLRFETEHDGVIGRWDRTRLDQVLSNLLANAVKYGAGKPVTVSVSEDDGVARIVVRDEGIGIAPQDIARIFGRFERAVSTRHYGGLGLGLFIAQQFVEAHGGQIHVSSLPSSGSEFIVVLPTGREAITPMHEERAQ